MKAVENIKQSEDVNEMIMIPGNLILQKFCLFDKRDKQLF